MNGDPVASTGQQSTPIVVPAADPDELLIIGADAVDNTAKWPAGGITDDFHVWDGPVTPLSISRQD